MKYLSKNRFFQIQDHEKLQLIVKFIADKFKKTKNETLNLFKKKIIYVNFKIVSTSYILKKNDLVQIFLNNKEKFFFLNSKNIQILHSNDDFLIINKNSGINSVEDKHHPKNNVFYLLNLFFKINNSEFNEEFFKVHRLDKPTSGLLIIAKNLKAANYFNNLFKKRLINKKYLAIVNGQLKNQKFVVSVPLKKPGKSKKALIGFSGKSSRTEFKLIKETNKFTLVQCIPMTGRTHQIRTHLKFINKPILNDSVYSKSKANFLFLHASELSFFFMINEFKFNFFSKLPNYFEKKLNVKYKN